MRATLCPAITDRDPREEREGMNGREGREGRRVEKGTERKSSKWNGSLGNLCQSVSFLGNSLSIPHMYADDSSGSMAAMGFRAIRIT